MDKGLKGLVKGGLKAMVKGFGKGGLRKEADEALEHSKPPEGRCKNGDPIDMVSGEMLMDETDVGLPGALPLINIRKSEYPPNYRESTHDEMTKNWTREGAQQGGRPLDASGNKIPRDQLTWFDAEGKTIWNPTTGPKLFVLLIRKEL